MSGDWYCRNCGYLSAGRVTFSETCDECHIPVEWHEEGQMTYIEELEADRTRLEWMVANTAEVMVRYRDSGDEYSLGFWRSDDYLDTEWSTDWRGLIDKAMQPLPPCEEA